MSVSQKLRPLGSGHTDRQTDGQTYGYPYGKIHNSQIATRTYGARRGLKHRWELGGKKKPETKWNYLKLIVRGRGGSPPIGRGAHGQVR